MPYITAAERERLDPSVNSVIQALHEGGWNAGSANYVIFTVLATWLARDTYYKTVASIMGTLAAVSAEFYRRCVFPFEANARALNGELNSVIAVKEAIRLRFGLEELP